VWVHKAVAEEEETSVRRCVRPQPHALLLLLPLILLLAPQLSYKLQNSTHTLSASHRYRSPCELKPAPRGLCF
jgi:hypothetical protein